MTDRARRNPANRDVGKIEDHRGPEKMTSLCDLEKIENNC